jgi:hypothetical protein
MHVSSVFPHNMVVCMHGKARLHVASVFPHYMVVCMHVKAQSCVASVFPHNMVVCMHVKAQSCVHACESTGWNEMGWILSSKKVGRVTRHRKKSGSTHRDALMALCDHVVEVGGGLFHDDRRGVYADAQDVDNVGMLLRTRPTCQCRRSMDRYPGLARHATCGPREKGEPEGSWGED